MEDLFLDRDKYLIRSKVEVPPLKPDLVTRANLLKKLDALSSPQVSIALLLAPPGFGKSSLLNVWAHQFSGKISWFAIEETENNPEAFWHCFAAAIKVAFPDFALIRSIKKSNASVDELHREWLIHLINLLHELDDNLVIVLEDFHNITDHQVIQDFTFFMDHLPRKLKIIISSQQELRIPLAKRKVNGSLLEIRTNDLEFTATEACDLLRKIGIRDFQEEDVHNLVNQTEGWVFGILLAAIAAAEKGRTLSLDTPIVSISDYLALEVLEGLSEQTLNFLLEISILGMVNADLCNFITGRADSSNRLANLEQCNLFLLPLDEKREWYRFHQSFLEILRAKQSLLSEDKRKTLHLKASEWCEKKGLIFPAFKHAMEAEAYDRAITIVEKNLFKMLDNTGLLHQSELVSQLPAEILHTRPALAIANAWLLSYIGRIGDAEKNLSMAENIINKVPEKDLQRRLNGKLLAVRSYISWLRGENEKTIKTAIQGLIDLPADDRMNRSITLISLGASFEDNGQSAEALEVYTEAVETCNVHDCRHVHIMACAAKMRLMILLGQFSEAETFGTTVINEVLRQNHDESIQDSALGNIYSHMAEIHRIRNNLPKALEYAEKGSHLAKNWDQVDSILTTRGIEAAVLWTMGRTTDALQLFKDLQAQAARVSQWYLKYLEAYMVLLGVDLDQMGGVPFWLNLDEPVNESTFYHHDVFFHRARARVLCSQRRFSEALNWLNLIHKDLQQTSGILMHGDCHIMLAICHFHLGNLTQATLELTPALEMAKSERAYSIFLDKGEMLVEVLNKLVFAPELVETVESLLQIMKDREHDQYVNRNPQKSIPHYMRLSSREREILGMLATHRTSAEIANMLTVSANTIRFHIKNIYTKLDAHSRNEAVVLGREFGLID